MLIFNELDLNTQPAGWAHISFYLFSWLLMLDRYHVSLCRFHPSPLPFSRFPFVAFCFSLCFTLFFFIFYSVTKHRYGKYPQSFLPPLPSARFFFPSSNRQDIVCGLVFASGMNFAPRSIHTLIVIDIAEYRSPGYDPSPLYDSRES